jgi:hypothetical protein
MRVLIGVDDTDAKDGELSVIVFASCQPGAKAALPLRRIGYDS